MGVCQYRLVTVKTGEDWSLLHMRAHRKICDYPTCVTASIASCVLTPTIHQLCSNVHLLHPLVAMVTIGIARGKVNVRSVAL